MLTKKPIRVAPRWITLLRAIIHATSFLWLSYVLFLGLTGGLAGDPVQYLLDFTGIGSINLMLLSLCVSPVSQYFKFAQLVRVRKTLGVYSAIYALAHLCVFIAFELQFEWLLIVSEIIERPYITVGFLGLLILTSLLVTSFEKVKQKMGRTWGKLHQWVYVALVLGLVHYLWSIKANELQPIVYIVFGIVLLLQRREKIKSIFK